MACRVIDGVQTTPGNRILVKNQTDARENGIYTASEGNWYRASDARSSRMIQKGTTVHVQQGTVNSSNVYSFQTFKPNIGTDNIVLAFYQSDDTVADVTAAVAAGVATLADETADGVQELQETGAEIIEEAAALPRLRATTSWLTAGQATGLRPSLPTFRLPTRQRQQRHPDSGQRPDPRPMAIRLSAEP